MHILFATRELQDEANAFQRLVKRYGEQKARKIRQRLAEIAAAESLQDLKTLPACKCQCFDEAKCLFSLVTEKPSILVFDITRGFATKIVIPTLVWSEVKLVEIVSLAKELK